MRSWFIILHRRSTFYIELVGEKVYGRYSVANSAVKDKWVMANKSYQKAFLQKFPNLRQFRDIKIGTENQNGSGNSKS